MLDLPQDAPPGPQASVSLKLTRIQVEGNVLIDEAELVPLLRSYQGRTVTLGDLHEATRRITDHYRERGFLLAYAYLPPQTIRDGVVRIAVVEPRYDRIAISGVSRLKPEQAARTLGLVPGSPVEQSALERGLLLLDQTPGVRVAGTLVPGAEPATTSLDVTLADTSRLRADLALDNHGNDYTGRARGLAQASLDNPFGHGGQLAVNALATERGLLRAGGLNLLSPDIRGGLRASLYGSRTDYRLGGAFAGLGQEGWATQWGVGLGYPVLLHPGRVMNVRLDLMRKAYTQTNTVVGLDDRSHVNLARLSVNGAFAHASGGMTLGSLSLGRGRLGLDSNDARLADASGPGAAGGFWVGQFQVRRHHLLPADFRLEAGLSGQVASRNLAPGEKFYLGGPDGVMSYRPGDGGGDAGALLSLRLARSLPVAGPDRLEAALVGQYGVVWQNHARFPGSATPNHLGLGGVGIELAYQMTEGLSARLDVMRRIGDSPPSIGTSPRNLLWARLDYAF